MSLALHELAWTERARCADAPSHWFYTDRAAVSPARDAALLLCNAGDGCPARRHCLAYAITHNERDGTWGGMLSRDRGDLARTRCPACRRILGRPAIAAMILASRQHTRCPACSAWVEVVPTWERPHRNSWVAGTGRRT